MNKILISSVLLISLNSFSMDRDLTDKSCAGPNVKVTDVDISLVSEWCGDQGKINDIWRRYNLGKGDWRGFGYENICDVRYPLARTINALWQIDKQSIYNVKFNKAKQLYMTNHSRITDWTSFVQDITYDGYTPICTDKANLLGSHPGISGRVIKLTQNLFNRYETNGIGSVIVHEATHEQVGHIDDNRCPRGASCDDGFGKFNANTTGIYYMVDAIANYKRNAYSGDIMMDVDTLVVNGKPKSTCYYESVLSAAERYESYSSVSSIAMRGFENPTYAMSLSFINQAILDPYIKTFEDGEDCSLCETEDYEFKAADIMEVWGIKFPKTKIGKNACNEVASSDNFGVNLRNKINCSIAKSPIDFESEIFASTYWASKNRVDNRESCAASDGFTFKNYCSNMRNISDDRYWEADKYAIVAEGYKYPSLISVDDAVMCCKEIKGSEHSKKRSFMQCSSWFEQDCSRKYAGDRDKIAACVQCSTYDDEAGCMRDRGY